MANDSITFEQCPRQLDLADYETGRERIVDFFEGRSGLLGVYDYGTVEDPGISDLDIILVFEDGSTPAWMDDLDAGFDPLAAELVGKGNIIALDRHTFERIHYIDPRLELQKLSGPDIPQQEPSEREQQYRDYASVVDWLPERLYQIERLRSANSLSVMRALQLLKSLGYTFQTVDDLMGFDRGVRFRERVADLRGAWFEMGLSNRRAELVETINTGAAVGSTALSQWFELRPAPVFDGDVEHTMNGAALSYFDGLAYITGSPDSKSVNDWHVVSFPSAWFDHFRAYADSETELGQLIERSSLGLGSEPTRLTSGYEAFLQKKRDICAGNFSWVRKNGLTAGALRFGFLLSRATWSDEAFTELRSELSTLADS